MQAPIQILPQSTSPGERQPFVFNRDDLAPGLQVTTNGQTGTVISRLDDGSYCVAFQRAAHDQPSLQPDTSPFFFNLNARELAAGVTFKTTAGGNTTTYYQNVRPDQIADVYAAGADALNLPLQQARAANGDDLIAARAETSIDAAAKNFYTTLSTATPLHPPRRKSAGGSACAAPTSCCKSAAPTLTSPAARLNIDQP